MTNPKAVIFYFVVSVLMMILGAILLFNKIQPAGSFLFLGSISSLFILPFLIFNSNGIYNYGSSHQNHYHEHSHTHTHSHSHTHNHFNHKQIIEGHETVRDMPDGTIFTTRHIKRWE
jgi:hypothetical protein